MDMMERLRSMLRDLLERYCEEIGLRVNEKKTRVWYLEREGKNGRKNGRTRKENWR